MEYTPSLSHRFVPSSENRARTTPKEKVFLSDEIEILKMIKDGYVLYQLMKSPAAYWLSREDVTHNPNITGAAFRSLKDIGAIVEHKSLYPYATYKITKHGERLIKSSEKSKSVPVKTAEPPNVTAQPVVGGSADVEHTVFENNLKNDSNVDRSSMVRLASGGYLFVLEFTNFTGIVKAASMLNLNMNDIAGLEVPKKVSVGGNKTVVHQTPRRITSVTCDFCHKQYEVRRYIAKVWRRYCGSSTSPCHKKYDEERTIFKMEYGRSPKAEDRELR